MKNTFLLLLGCLFCLAIIILTASNNKPEPCTKFENIESLIDSTNTLIQLVWVYEDINVKDARIAPLEARILKNLKEKCVCFNECW